jgi:hypothetical protein
MEIIDSKDFMGKVRSLVTEGTEAAKEYDLDAKSFMTGYIAQGIVSWLTKQGIEFTETDLGKLD